MRRSTVVLLVATLAAALVPAQAMAAPLVGVAAGIFTSIGVSAGVASILAEVAVTALTVAANYAIQSLFGPKKSPFSTQIQLNSGGVVPRSFLFGEDAATAGSLIYHGATAAGGGTPNAYYVAEYALSDLPVSALTGIIVDGTTVTWDPDATPAAFGIAIPEYKKSGKDYLWITFSDGTQSTPDAFMRTWFGEDPDYPYTADMVGIGVAKVRIVAKVSQKLFPSAPQSQWICRGIPFYDVRDDSTAGGSGSQRWSDPSTWLPSGNAAVVLYNVFRGIFYGGKWFYGGQNLDASRLPYASWAAAANACDIDVDLVAGGTEKQFRVSGEIQVATQPVDAITMLLACASGRPAEIAGSYKVLIGAPGAAVVSITDDDILVTEQQQFDPFPNLDATINAITARYPEPSQAYALTDAPPLYNSTYETADGNRRLVSAVEFDFATSNTQVQRLMKALVEEARRFRKHNQVMPPSMYQLEPLDVVSWTSARNGYSSKLFRIDAATDGDNCDQGWTLTEVDAADFDWDPDADEQAVSNPPLVTQRPASQAIVDWAVSGVVVYGDNGSARAGLRLAWNPDVDDVSGVQFQVRLASDQSTVLSGQTVDLEAGLIDLTQNLLPFTNYEARGRYIPISARDTDWSDWLAGQTPNVGISPSELSAAIQAKLDQIEQQFPADLLSIRYELDGVANSLNTQVSALKESTGRINIGVGQRIGDVEATAEFALTASATANSAVAAIFGDTYVVTPNGAAESLFQMVSSSDEDGAITSISFQARATRDDVFTEAGLTIQAAIAALGYGSQIVLSADRTIIQNPNGTVSINALDLTITGNEPLPAPIIDGEIRVDLSTLRTNFETLIDQDCVYRYPNGAKSGKRWSHLLKMDSAGGHTITFYASELFGSAPAIVTAANVLNIVDGQIIRSVNEGVLLQDVVLRQAALEATPPPFVLAYEKINGPTTGATRAKAGAFIPMNLPGAQRGDLVVVISGISKTANWQSGQPAPSDVGGTIPATVSGWSRGPQIRDNKTSSSGGGSSSNTIGGAIDFKRLDGTETTAVFPDAIYILRFTGGGILANAGQAETSGQGALSGTINSSAAEPSCIVIAAALSNGAFSVPSDWTTQSPLFDQDDGFYLDGRYRVGTSVFTGTPPDVDYAIGDLGNINAMLTLVLQAPPF